MKWYGRWKTLSGIYSAQIYKKRHETPQTNAVPFCFGFIFPSAHAECEPKYFMIDFDFWPSSKEAYACQPFRKHSLQLSSYTIIKGETKKLCKLYTNPTFSPASLWISARYKMYSLCSKLYTNYTQTIHWTLHWESKRQRVKKTKRLRAKDERTAFLRH